VELQVLCKTGKLWYVFAPRFWGRAGLRVILQWRAAPNMLIGCCPRTISAAICIRRRINQGDGWGGAAELVCEVRGSRIALAW